MRQVVLLGSHSHSIDATFFYWDGKSLESCPSSISNNSLRSSSNSNRWLSNSSDSPPPRILGVNFYQHPHRRPLLLLPLIARWVLWRAKCLRHSAHRCQRPPYLCLALLLAWPTRRRRQLDQLYHRARWTTGANRAAEVWNNSHACVFVCVSRKLSQHDLSRSKDPDSEDVESLLRRELRR